MWSDLQLCSPLSTGRKEEHVAVDAGKLGIRVEEQLGELFCPWCNKELRGVGDSGGLAEDGETDLHTVPRAHLGFTVTRVKAQAAGLRFAPATVISAQEEAHFTRLGLQ